MSYGTETTPDGAQSEARVPDDEAVLSELAERE
jgi:hypothetical protein